MTVVRLEDLSHIYNSNDGVLGIERLVEDGVEGWIVFRRNNRDTDNVEFFTVSRDAAESFVHGYDVGCREK